MLQIIEQGVISNRYVIRFSDMSIFQLMNTQPTQDEINEELLIYEKRLLDQIDIKGEESDIRSNESGDGRTDPGHNAPFILPQGQIPA